jgi:hypothetical protein
MTTAGQRWTRNFPSVSGWYWFRSGMTPRPVVEEVTKAKIEQYQRLKPGELLVSDPGEWQGPLTPNEETE